MQLQKVKLPNNEEVTSDFGDIKYDVTENGSYEFVVSYVLTVY